MGHTGAIHAATFAPEGDVVVTGGEDGTVRLFHGPSGELLATAPGHEGPVRAIAIAPDGQSLASAGDDAVVRILPLSYEAWLRRACALSLGRDDAETRRLCTLPEP